MPFKPKNSKYYHYDFQVRGIRFQGSCGTENHEKAKAVEAKERAKAGLNPHVQNKYTLGEAFGTYYTDVARHQSSAATAYSQAKLVLQIMDGDKYLHKLTNADIQFFVSRRRSQVSNATVNRQLQLMGRAIRYMHRTYSARIADLDFKGAQTKEPEGRIRELSLSEETRLFEHLRADYHPLVKFALLTGARKDTLRRLKWKDIDFEHRTAAFRVKGAKAQMFPLNPTHMALLGSLPRSEVLAHREYVFTFINQQNGERRRFVSGASHFSWLKAIAAAGIDDFRFHDLRHTFATRMLRHCGDITRVSKLLGHKTLEMTMRYAHIQDEDLRDAMADFGAESRSLSERSG